MSKVNYRKCDICGDRLSRRQGWAKFRPSLWQKIRSKWISSEPKTNFDVCSSCIDEIRKEV